MASDLEQKARELLAAALRKRNENRLAGMAEIPSGLDQIATHIALDAIVAGLRTSVRQSPLYAPAAAGVPVAWQSQWPDGSWHEIDESTYNEAVANDGWVRVAGGEGKMVVRALCTAAHAAAGVPEGWALTREGDGIRLSADGVASFLIDRKMFHGDLQEFIWLFLDDLLSNPERQAVPEDVRRDAERLDFVERHWFYRPAAGEPLGFGFNECWEAPHKGTLREAIDAAMAAQPQGEEVGDA